MCEAISMALTAASAVMGMVGQYSQGKAQKKAAEYNAQVAANDAAMQQQLAQNDIAKGAADKERQQREALRHMGTLRANTAAAGFELDSGSALDLLAENATEHQYDSNIIDNNTAQSVWQRQVNITGAENNRAMSLYQAKQAGTNTLMNMGSTLLGGMAKGMGQYSALPKSPAPSSTFALKNSMFDMNLSKTYATKY